MRRRALGAGRDAKGRQASPRATPAEPGGHPEAELRTRAGPRAGAQVSPGWDSPGNNTGVGCHFLLQCWKVKSESEVAQSCRTLATPWTAAYQAPPSMGFSRQKYWSGVPLPSLKWAICCSRLGFRQPMSPAPPAPPGLAEQYP